MRSRYELNLRAALTRRALPAEIGAAFRASHALPRDERPRVLRFIRDAQLEAHRVTGAERV